MSDTLETGDPPDNPPQQTPLTNLGDIEKTVQEYALTVAKKHRINPDHFVVHLVVDMERGQMDVIAGQVVQIVLLWPYAQTCINELLDSAFRLMKRFPMRRTFDIVPIGYVSEQREERRKFFKHSLGDIGDSLGELIPRARLKMHTDTVTTLEDTKTGVKVSVTHKGKTERFEGNGLGLWLELSRQVNMIDASTGEVAGSRHLEQNKESQS